MPFRRAFSTLGCPQLELAEAFALAVRHGIDAIELRALGGTLDLPDYFSRHFGEPAKFHAELRRAPVAVPVIDTSFRLIGSGETERVALLGFVPWAEAAGVPWLRVFDGGKTNGAPEFAERVATMAWWRALRSQHEWRTDLLVETHDALFSADAIGQFVSAAPGTKILWDAHHTWHRGGEDPAITWRAIRPHVAHVHVKDSVSRPNGRHDHTYVLPGDGEFPMGQLRSALEREPFAGAVCLEWERLWHPDLPPLDHALRAAAQARWW